MASRKTTFLSKPSNFIFPTTTSDSHPQQEQPMLEFDEADLFWNNNNNNSNKVEPKKALPSSRSTLKRVSSRPTISPISAPSSLPVNIPDWSKILKDDYKGHPKWENDDEFDEEHGFEDHQIKVPPHEYLARTRGASLSVHEGIGRTLKGRDLRRVRNAIWKKVGFED